MPEQNNLLIKVCGIRDPLNLEQVCDLLPEYIGFIFYSGSKRFVGANPDPMLFDIPDQAIKKVGVFVNEDLKQVRASISRFKLDAVQLHGSETVAYCQQLSAETVEVFKVIDPHASVSEVESYLQVVDHFLLDSAGEGKGGSGTKFDWRLLENLPPSASFLLSGGIGPQDAANVLALDFKGLMGVDVNSRFELSPGLKNIERLKKFVIEIRK